ncbi:MAG: hypothetical protein ACI4V7_01720 [Succinivibrionaceae bacterium]
MCEVCKSLDNRYTYKNYIEYDDGIVLVTIEGSLINDKLSLILIVSPKIKGKYVTFVSTRYELELTVINNKLSAIDKSMFKDLPIEIVSGIEEQISRFFSKLCQTK